METSRKQAPGLSPAAIATIGGQVLAALALLVQWAAAPDLFPGFPPGILYIGAAAAIVWLDRGTPWSPLAAVVLSLWISIGGLAGGDLVDNLTSPDTLLVAGNVVMLAGLLTSSVAGVLAIRHNRRHLTASPPRPLSRANPRRVAVGFAVAGMLADAVGDAAPEALDWDGPGPVLFAVLALLVAFVPGRFMLLLSIPLCAAFIMGVFANPEPMERLTNPTAHPLGFAGTLVQLLGLTTAVIAGVVAVTPKRPSPARTP